MNLIQRTIVLFLVAGSLVGYSYLQVKEHESHQLIASAIGLLELVVFGIALTRLENRAVHRQWSYSRTASVKTVICVGLLFLIVMVDRMFSFEMEVHHLHYKMFWTLILPGSFLVIYLVRVVVEWIRVSSKS
ncbi:MAG: hypothetical protein K1X47_05690 [Cyclobacteriaceae bacterium]|nr:hypothetical protein [Cyclobacteriaceae bacterium]